MPPLSITGFPRGGMAQRSGSALLIVLGCVALLTVLVLSFFVTSRTEFSLSNFYSRNVNTKLLSENVINLVEAQLREGARSSDLTSTTYAPLAWASQPGMIRTYDARGQPHMFYKLYSSDTMTGTLTVPFNGYADTPAAGWGARTNVYTDLNEPITTAGGGTEYPIIDPGALNAVEGFSYTAQTETSNALPMPVKWLYVLRDGTTTVATPAGTGAAVTIPGASLANPIVGRVAFWTDDETCKVNINTASEGLFWDQPIGNSTEELGAVTGNNQDAYPWGFMGSVPATLEFQRVPGHPAQTSLSAVFGYGPNPVLPDTSLSPTTGPQWPLTAPPQATPGSYATVFAPYYNLTPRLQAGGSMGGAAQSVTGFTPPSYRLYDSVDELDFDPNRTSMSGAGSSSLYPAANGASPSGRSAITRLTPTIINQRRFFLTAHSRAPEETLFGTPRISLWPLQADLTARTAKDNLLAFCSTIGSEPYYFQRATYYQFSANGSQTLSETPSSQDQDQDFSGVAGTVGSPTTVQVSPGIGNVTRNQNLYAYLQALSGGSTANGGLTIPGFGGNFITKYPGNGTTSDRDQILTEMFDMIRSGVNTTQLGTGIYPNYTYTPFNINGGQDPASGTTFPIGISTNGGTANTHGLGRNYTIAEAALVFAASGIDLSPSAPGTLDTGGTPLPLIPTAMARISIGTGLPWACEEDYWSTTPRIFLYFDTAAKVYGNYYLTGVGNTTADIYPGTNPVPSTAVRVPIFCYWDTGLTHPAYGSYFRAPDTGNLCLCNSPPNAPAPTGNLVALPTTACTIGDPQTTQVQAFLVIRPYGVMPGPPIYFPNVRFRVTNLDKLALTNGGSLSFPSSATAVALVNTGNNISNETAGGLTEAIFNHSTGNGTVATYPLYSQSVSIPTSYPSPYGGEDEPSLTNTSNTGSGIPPPGMVQIHQLANGTTYAGATMTTNSATIQIDVTDGTTTPAANAKILQTVFINLPSMTLPVPTVERSNPQTGAEASGIGGNNTNAAGGSPSANTGIPRIRGYGGNPFGAPTLSSSFGPLAYYYQMDFNSMVVTNRFLTTDITALVNRGDVVRSFVVNPKGPIAGDMRLLAANPIRTTANATGALATDDFAPLGMQRSAAFYSAFPTQGPAYGTPASLFIRQLHSLITDLGRPFAISLLQTSQTLLQVPGGILDSPVDRNQGAGMGETSGALVVESVAGTPQASPPAVSGENYSAESSPVATPELNGAYMDSAQQIPGDWSLGIGDQGDGAFVVKPDEGEQNPVFGGQETGYSDPWYTTNGNLTFVSAAISYAPNRQIASGIVFGTLPCRVFGGLPGFTTAGGVPWCTLLFNPNPAANDNGKTSVGYVHPGFGVGSTGTPGPGDLPPFSIPADHLWLDLFWMPVIEPYAISEPFSTAGKVNMNYDIVPFGGYIHRSTALHAVLKATRITAIASTFNDAGTPAATATATSPQGDGNFPSAKAVGVSRFSRPPANQNYSIRYGINLQATIDDPNSAFQRRFTTVQDIFRSASEICNVFLVPQQVPGSLYNPAAPTLPSDASYASMQTWWAGNQLTGDNGRKSPYNQIYPRLTTKSNTYQIHMRVQVLSQSPADRASGTFNAAAGDSVTGEYRGSAIVERYLDPNQTSPTPLPDFATAFAQSPSAAATVDGYVRYRVVNIHDFSP